MLSLESFLLHHEPQIRLGFFCGVFIVLAAWEALAPRRSLILAKPGRWLGNVGIAVLNTIILRLVFPWAAVGSAQLAATNHWGLFNTWILPSWLVVLLVIVALDLIIYCQHVLFHALPTLWRLHQVHHADRDLDVTTGLRFHPLEILLSMAIKMVAVVILGAPASAVLIFEVVLNATALFNHSNIALPGAIERLLRWFVVTPDMHCIHHSVIEQDTNSNFGFNLSWWDYLLGTYRHQSANEKTEITIGLMQYQQELGVGKLLWMLRLPIMGDTYR